MNRGRMYFEASEFDAEVHGIEPLVEKPNVNVCQKCGQPLDYKYYKQVSRCYNCDFNRVPASRGAIIP